VVVEGDPAVGQLGPRLRLADVMQQGGQPQHQVAVQPVPVLQPDGLPQHGERVLIDVLVPEVLIGLEPQLRHLGQHPAGHAGLHQQVDAAGRVGGQHQLGQLIGDPLDRHVFEQLPRVPAHGLAHVIGHGEAQLGGEPGCAQDAQCVVGERFVRRSGRPQHLLLQRGQAAERIDQLMPGQPGGHRVHGEVPPPQVPLERRAVVHGRPARPWHVLLAAVGRHLQRGAVLAQPDGAEVDAHGPHRVRPPVHDPQDLGGRGVGGQIEVARLAAEEHVPDRAADQCELVSVLGEPAPEFVGDRRHLLQPEQGRSGLALVVVQRVHGAHQRRGSGIRHGHRGY
jgi:hypothetical protein